jgi:hypothetical protein
MNLHLGKRFQDTVQSVQWSTLTVQSVLKKIELILDPFQNNKKKERKICITGCQKKKEVRIDFENRLILW